MSQPEKPKRRYNATRRQVQARETRHQITEAARSLFSVHGYSGATIEAIATKAGVAPETVYAAFGNKRSILKHLIDVAVGGDDTPTPLLQRPGPKGVLQEADPRRLLQLFAADIAPILERVAPIFEVVHVAAKSEPLIADLRQKLLAQRRRNMTHVVQHLANHGPLRDGLTEGQAADIVWTLTSPEVFRLLREDRAWSQKQYIEWLIDSLSRLLLP